MVYLVIACFITAAILIPFMLFELCLLTSLPGPPSDLNYDLLPPIFFILYLTLGIVMAIILKIRYNDVKKGFKMGILKYGGPLLITLLLLIPVVLMCFVIKPFGPPTYYFFVHVENHYHMEDYGLNVSIEMDSKEIFHDGFLVGHGGGQMDVISFEKHTFEISIQSYDFNKTRTDDIDFSYLFS